MRIDKFETREEDNKIYVFLEIPHEWTAGKIPRFRATTADVLKILKEKGIEHGPCIRQSELRNWREYSRRGEWIFEKKILDISPEPVIIVEEKQVQPKPTRKRRTRSSTKKVSTEE